MNKVNFLRGLVSISCLDKKLTEEIDNLIKYYLEVDSSKKKEQLIKSIFAEKFDLNEAKNTFDDETKELFFNSSILISEIQLNNETKDELILLYAKELNFDIEKIKFNKRKSKKRIGKKI